MPARPQRVEIALRRPLHPHHGGNRELGASLLPIIEIAPRRHQARFHGRIHEIDDPHGTTLDISRWFRSAAISTSPGPSKRSAGPSPSTPGSRYSEGVLDGVVVEVKGDKIT